MKFTKLHKERSQRIHAKRRALERFGVQLSTARLDELVGRIEDGDYQLVERQSQRLSTWRVELAGQPALAVYDCRHRTIVTFLFETLVVPVMDNVLI